MGYAFNDQHLRLSNTDLYQLTMSQVWFNKGMHEEESVYYLHWRKPPFRSNYTCVAGLEEAVDFLDNFGFNDDEIEYLRQLNDDGHRIFTDEFIDYLKNMKLQLDIDAVREGDVMTCEAPVIRIKGPRIQGQLIESILLEIMNSNSMIATRASLLSTAVEEQPIINMSLRRSADHGPRVSRSAHIGGCATTASVHHARILGITPAGTMAHAFMMSYQKDDIPNHVTELLAFEDFLKTMPTKATLLVDTYDAHQGIQNAIKASINTGIPLKGIRLDSGDLYTDAWYARDQLDEAVKTYPHLFSKTNIIATDGLDETRIRDLREQSKLDREKPFPVTVWGVGTKLGNPGPFDGGVYKICARLVDKAKKLWQGCMKIAGVNTEDATLPSSKASIPGIDLDVLRLWKNGRIVADIITDNALNQDQLLKGGIGINAKNNSTIVNLPEFDKAETLLAPVYKRNADGISEKVFVAPKTKIRYDGEEITDLCAIKAFHFKQKSALSAETQVLIDPRVQAQRKELIAKTNAELTPGGKVNGELEVVGSAQSREVA